MSNNHNCEFEPASSGGVEGMQHTPGPWLVERCPEGLDIYAPAGRVAMLNDNEPEEGNNLLPNAYLIAAAPEMLAALQRLGELLEDWPTMRALSASGSERATANKIEARKLVSLTVAIAKGA